MNWYYAIAGDRRGPVDQAQFDSLVQQGIITMTTLVWRDGMTDWQPYSAVAPAILPGRSNLATSPARSVTGFATCGNCGQMVPETDMVLIGDRKYCAACKPLVVQRIKEGVTIATDAEEIRREYIKHEMSVKSVGVLYFLAATAFIVGGIAMAIPLVAPSAMNRGGDSIPALIGMLVICLGLGTLLFFVGRGLRRLSGWTRIPVGILSGIGLLNIPIGTLIHGYILYLVFCKKGQMVFSDEYKAIIAQTPNVKYRSSCLLWVLVIILATIVIVAITAYFSRPVR